MGLFSIFFVQPLRLIAKEPLRSAKPGHDNKQKRPGLSTQPFKTLTANEAGANPQLAFFTNSTLPTFFWIARFRSSARGDSTSALAFMRKPSRPPL